MRTTSWSLAGTFRDVVGRTLAALHQHRAIEARRVLHRYRDLLEEQHDTLLLNEIISVCNEEDISRHAYRSDEHPRAAGPCALERA